MAKSPNYQFERRERDRLKAIKSAEKAAAKREQRDGTRDATAQPDTPGSESGNT
jgi:hypothetical protein